VCQWHLSLGISGDVAAKITKFAAFNFKIPITWPFLSFLSSSCSIGNVLHRNADFSCVHSTMQTSLNSSQVSCSNMQLEKCIQAFRNDYFSTFIDVIRNKFLKLHSVTNSFGNIPLVKTAHKYSSLRLMHCQPTHAYRTLVGCSWVHFNTYWSLDSYYISYIVLL